MSKYWPWKGPPGRAILKSRRSWPSFSVSLLAASRISFKNATKFWGSLLWPPRRLSDGLSNYSNEKGECIVSTWGCLSTLTDVLEFPQGVWEMEKETNLLLPVKVHAVEVVFTDIGYGGPDELLAVGRCGDHCRVVRHIHIPSTYGIPCCQGRNVHINKWFLSLGKVKSEKTNWIPVSNLINNNLIASPFLGFFFPIIMTKK